MAFFPSALQHAGWTGPACVLCLLIGSLKSENATQVLYVANAEMLTDGGFFSYNEAAGAWDTPQSAQFILHNLLASHKDALEAMRTKDGARSLAEVGRCLHASLQLSEQAPGMLCICSCPVVLTYLASLLSALVSEGETCVSSRISLCMM